MKPLPAGVILVVTVILLAGCLSPQVAIGKTKVNASIDENDKGLFYPSWLYYLTLKSSELNPDFNNGIVNFDVDAPAATTLTFRVSIPGFSDGDYIKTLDVPKGKNKYSFTPTFNRLAFNNTGERRMLINAKVEERGKSIYEETLDVNLKDFHLVRWTIPLDSVKSCKFVEGNNCFDVSPMIASFVTPNDQTIIDIVNESANFLSYTNPDTGQEIKLGFDGYQGSPLPSLSNKQWEAMQAVALWKGLSQHSMKYINAPLIYPEQYVKLPAETINSGGGNCIDLVLTYASLLAKIGMKPHLILSFREQHSVTCFEYGDGGFDCMDVTTIGNQNVEQAVQEANDAGNALVSQDQRAIDVDVQKAILIGIKYWVS